MFLGSAKQAVVIIGAGPAGLAPLCAAANVGRLHDLIQGGVTILEQGDAPGGGSLGQYAIRSDSSADAFLDIVTRTEDPRLSALRDHPIARTLSRYGSGAAPLALVARFLDLVGSALCAIVAGSDHGRVCTGVVALSLTQVSASCWRTRFRHLASGVEEEIDSSSVVLATGASQPIDRLYREPVAGRPLLPQHQGKLLQSGDIMTSRGAELVREQLLDRRDPRVVIVGGSTSAGAIAARFLKHFTDVNFGEGGVTIMHRQPLRIFYESVREAEAEGYAEFTEQDVCRITGRVYRFGGFRLDSRELLMSARGVGGRPAEPRVALFHLHEQNYGTARKLLGSADLIVAAMGYRPRVLPVFDSRHRGISLHVPQGAAWSIVDQCCRVLTSNGLALPGLFAIGLAVGPRPSWELGGEANFTGQVNSLWLWQHTLGLRIVDGIQERFTAESAKQDVHLERPSEPHFAPLQRQPEPALAATIVGAA